MGVINHCYEESGDTYTKCKEIWRGGGMSSLRRKRQEYCESRGSARIIEEQ